MEFDWSDEPVIKLLEFLWMVMLLLPSALTWLFANEIFRDWVKALGSPITTVGIAIFITLRLEKQKREEDRAREERRQQQEEASRQDDILAKYFEQMTDLMVSQSLAKAEHDDSVAQVAQALTVRVILRLSSDRVKQVRNFLVHSRLSVVSRDDGPSVLKGCNLSGENLINCFFQELDFSFTNFTHANLNEANFTNANLCHAKFIGANLCRANLSLADLRGAEFSHADLRGANLRNAELNGTNLRAAKYSSLTVFPSRFSPRDKGMIEMYDDGKRVQKAE